jgi:hypothetical protein
MSNNDDAKVVIIGGEKDKSCAGGCGKQGTWRHPTRNYVCQECKQKPPHALMCKSKVLNEYNFTAPELQQYVDSGAIRAHFAINKYPGGSKWTTWFLVHDIHALVAARDKARASLNIQGA